MEKYILEIDEIVTHILQGEWEAAHEKALTLVQAEPENIEFIVLLTASSAYGSFFQDAVDYGKKALLWAEKNDSDLTELNVLKLSVTDLRELIAQAYFGLKDFSAAADELDKIEQASGRLPDGIKQFAVKNENMRNGADAALRLAEQLGAEFDDQTSDDFYAFQKFEVQICFHEITTLANGVKFPENLRLDEAQKMAVYLLRMVNSLEKMDESRLDEDSKVAFRFGKEWLVRVFVVLYKGRSADGPEMKINHHYAAARECIMVLEKLSDFGNSNAQGLLGEIYANGYNVEQDDAKAFHYYRLSCENGNNTALTKVALYYDEGAVVEKDPQKALEYAKRAVEAGDPIADAVLGQIYADSLGDIEQGIVWLKKAYENGNETAKNILLRLARENIENFDGKLEFILDTHEKLGRDIEPLGTSSVTELGKKYARCYMEIEKYYIAPMDRLKFINVCLNVQADLVTSPDGIVSGDYFIGQFEKLIREDYETASRVAKERRIASRINNLQFAELVEGVAAGKLPEKTDLNWKKIGDYYFPKALELGWDGYYADGTGPWEPDTSNASGNSATPKNESVKLNFAAMDAYDKAPEPEPKSGGCYIATAVYGSYDCPEVWVLRRFRDHSLAKNLLGRLFIKLYYSISPTLVKFFGGTVWFQRFWKCKLDKIVQELRKSGYADTPYSD